MRIAIFVVQSSLNFIEDYRIFHYLKRRKLNLTFQDKDLRLFRLFRFRKSKILYI